MRIHLLITLFLCSCSSVFAGNIVCKAMPQNLGTYTLIDLKDAKGNSTGHFDVTYESADGSVKKTLSKNTPLRNMLTLAEEAGYAYEIYLEASEAYPARTPVRFEDAAHYARIFGGPADDPELVLMFWLDASGKIIDIFGESSESFLCEENEKNPTTLPEAPRVG